MPVPSVPVFNTRPAVLSDIDGERGRQNAKWGEQNHTDPLWLAIATEELGEAAQEVLTEEFGTAGNGHGDLREELVQCAAVLVAWIECIDRSNQS